MWTWSSFILKCSTNVNRMWCRPWSIQTTASLMRKKCKKVSLKFLFCLFGKFWGWLVDPLEIKLIWVVDWVGGCQYQRVVALVTQVSLLFHAFQLVRTHFIGRTIHITLGIQTLPGADVVLKMLATRPWNTSLSHGYLTTGHSGWCFVISSKNWSGSNTSPCSRTCTSVI